MPVKKQKIGWLDHVTEFSPVEFRVRHQLKQWAPGNQVVFYRPWDMMIVFTIFFFLLGVVLAAMGLSPSFEENMTATDFFVLWGAVGLLLWMGFHGTLFYLPHTVTINWVNQTVTSSDLFRTWALPFHEIGGIILQKRISIGWNFSVVPGPRSYGVRLEISKKGGRNTPSSFVLLESESYFESDFSLGLERWTCLLQVLSDSLKIPGQVLSMDGKILQTMNKKEIEITDDRI